MDIINFDLPRDCLAAIVHAVDDPEVWQSLMLTCKSVYYHCDLERRIMKYPTMDKAARHGHLDVVQWLHEHRQEGCTKNAMDWAAMNGQLNVVQWLRDHYQEDS